MFNPPAFFVAPGQALDYTPGSAVAAGAIVLLGSIPVIAVRDIPAGQLGAVYREGVFDVQKDASVFALGDPVYWNPTGSSLGGVAAAGCATSVSAGNYLLGYAVIAGLTGDNTVRMKLSGTKGNATPRVNVATVAAAGSNAATATPLTEGLNWVTAANATVGALLPPGVAGMQVIVKNDDTANAAVPVYPGTGVKINAVAAASAYTMAAKTCCLFVCYSPTQWFTLPLLAS